MVVDPQVHTRFRQSNGYGQAPQVPLLLARAQSQPTLAPPPNECALPSRVTRRSSRAVSLCSTYVDLNALSMSARQRAAAVEAAAGGGYGLLPLSPRQDIQQHY